MGGIFLYIYVLKLMESINLKRRNVNKLLYDFQEVLHDCAMLHRKAVQHTAAA